MRYPTQCVTCGQYVVLVSPVVFAGWYPCPACEEGGLCVPVTKVTPCQGSGAELAPDVIVQRIDASGYPVLVKQ